MIHFHRRLSIDAAPKKVWGVLSQFMKINEMASVDALTNGEAGLGSKRRCHFKDGNSLVEEIVAWTPGRGYRVSLSETAPMPLKEACAELKIIPDGADRCTVEWGMDYRLKYGPLGWLIGQTMMKAMMGKVLDTNLQALAEKWETNPP